MKSRMYLCAVVLVMCAIASHADTVQIEGIKYSYDTESHEASVTGATNPTMLDTLVIPDAIVIGEEVYPVTSIARRSFAYIFKNLKFVTIGASVRSIGEYAFRSCPSLSSIILPASITEIGRDAFDGCTSLENADFGSIESLCAMSFGTSLSNPFYFTQRLSVGGTEVQEVVIPEGISRIEDYVFNKCANITSLSLPSTLKEIGTGAFQGCTGIGSMNIPEGTTSIGGGAFAGCSRIISLSLPSTLKEIGAGAFQGCSGISILNIPEGVTSLSESAFEGCSSLKEIRIPSTMETIGRQCFNDLQDNSVVVNYASIESLCAIQFGDAWSNPLRYAKKLLINGVEITDLVIPEGVTDIGHYAFSYCKGLKSVKFPDSIKMIGEAFGNCPLLKKVEFPSVEKLCGINFFGEWNYIGWKECDIYIDGQEIKDLYIPEGIERVPSYAFRGSNITSVTMSDDVKSIGYLSFSNCPNLKYVKFGRGIERFDESFVSCPQFDHLEFADINCLLRMSFDDIQTEIFENPLYYAHHLYSNGEEVKEITFPEGLKEIGYCVLYNCESVEHIHIPEGVEIINPLAFANCTNLVSIDLPSTLQYIYSSMEVKKGGSAFDFCESLEEIRVNENNTSYDSRENCNAAIFTEPNRLMIGGNNTIIPSSIVEINFLAFYGRKRLTSIHVPPSVNYFGRASFGECSSLKDFYYDAHALPKMANAVFTNTPIENATLHVPEDMIETFRETAPWSGFGQIVALQPGDMPDGIENPFPTFPRVGAIYDLQGRRLSNRPEKGMYIEDGQVKVK